MRDCQLVVHDGLVPMLVIVHLSLKLKRVYIARRVVKVDRNCLLFEKLDTFYANLRKLLIYLSLFFILFVSLYFVDAVFLIRFVNLSCYDLF